MMPLHLSDRLLASGETPEGQTEIGVQGEPLSCFLPQLVGHHIVCHRFLFENLIQTIIVSFVLLIEGPSYVMFCVLV